MRRTSAYLIAALLVAGAAAPAGADPDPRKTASAHARKGAALYNLGKFDAAITEFEQAYELVQSESLLFNLGQAHRQLDHCEEALRYYRLFLGVTADEARAAEVRKLVPKLELACSAKRDRPNSVAPEAGDPGDAGAASPEPVATAAPTADGTSADADAAPSGERVALAQSDDAADVRAAAAPAPTDATTLLVGGGLTAGAVFANGTVTTAGAAASVALPRTWFGVRWLVGGEVGGAAVMWSDRSRSGVSPSFEAFATVRARMPSPVVVEAGAGAGVLVLMGLDQRGHTLAMDRAGGTQAVPGARGEMLVAMPIGRTFELYAAARAGIYPALGALEGSVLLELTAAAGLRLRR